VDDADAIDPWLLRLSGQGKREEHGAKSQADCYSGHTFSCQHFAAQGFLLTAHYHLMTLSARASAPSDFGF
jgi:hypothetical protein